jgi:hypothetical protein
VRVIQCKTPPKRTGFIKLPEPRFGVFRGAAEARST